ncbi:MAG: anaerobic ribonucleoside-triphosphate reductase activating protein [bacterium]|nr:anaerobic ribonucleoside-triphosphate reductase activating protein [bacterium]
MKSLTEIKTHTAGQLKIKGFLENSLIDWDGKISAVIFISGCNFACPFCHNGVLVKPNNDVAEIAQDKILALLKAKREWLDGVVISGGEPCMYLELFELMREIKKMGYPIKIDTNGSHPKPLEALIKYGLVDYVAMDIKAPLNDHYKKLSGSNINVERIKRSIEVLRGSAIEYEFRTTFVPTMLEKNDLVAIATFLQGSKRFFIQQFKPKQALAPELRELEPYSNKYLLETLQECRKFIPNSRLRD